ncbi:MAG: prephenate dehydrogenase/arogenate dehydrogenase family protein [Candidatus Bathyarchaeales archaeon]
MKVAVIGAGKMGRWFAKFFLEQGLNVVVSDKDQDKLARIKEELKVETASSIDAVKSADRVLICVPIESFENVIAEIQAYIRPEQTVMDICSVKERPVEIMHRYIRNGAVLGTHPMFGPGVKTIKNQNFVLTPTNAEEEKLAEEFGNWLKEKGARVFFMSPREHDELMSIVLGLPYFLSLATCDTLIGYGCFPEAQKVSGASYKFLLTLVEAIASEEAEFSTSLQMSLPENNKVGELFLKKAAEWLELINKKDKKAFLDKVKRLKAELEKIDPNYSKSYEIMYKMLDVFRSEN